MILETATIVAPAANRVTHVTAMRHARAESNQRVRAAAAGTVTAAPPKLVIVIQVLDMTTE